MVHLHTGKGENVVSCSAQNLDDVKALLMHGALNHETAAAAIEAACAAHSDAAVGSGDQLAALEVLEQCSQLEAGAAAMCAPSSRGCETLLTVSVRAQKHSAHQLSAIAGLANMAAGSQHARLTMVHMGVTEVLLSLTSDPELMGTEHQRPALIALVNLACERSNLSAMAQAGTLDVVLMLLSTPAIADSDLCVLVLNLLLAFTVAGPEAVDFLLQRGVPISLIHFFMTRPALEQHANAEQVMSHQ